MIKSTKQSARLIKARIAFQLVGPCKQSRPLANKTVAMGTWRWRRAEQSRAEWSGGVVGGIKWLRQRMLPPTRHYRDMIQHEVGGAWHVETPTFNIVNKVQTQQRGSERGQGERERETTETLKEREREREGEQRDR